MTTEEIDAAIDALYAGPLDAFIAARQDLAKRLRAAGRREDADRVKALPKPSATAWAVNHAWWHARDDFDAMLRAGEALRAAQMAALQREPTDVRAAIAARDERVARVAEIACAAAGRSGGDGASDTARRRIVATLEALTTSGVPAGVRLGRLSADLASTGLDVLSAFAASLPPAAVAPAGPPLNTPVAAPAPAAPPSADRSRTRQARAEAARAALADAEAALADAERAHDECLRAADDASAQLRTAESRVAALETELVEARRIADEASRRHASAAKAAESARNARERAVAAAQAASRQLAGLAQ